MKSVWNKILRVDLTSRKVTKENLPADVMENFLGGAGLGAWVLYNEVPANVKALDPENRIIFATGPFQGLRHTGAAKWTVVTKSPEFEANATSCATQGFGIELKKTGVDALIVQGKADKPVYIKIEDDNVEICEASHIWGKYSYDTEDILKGELGKDFSVACIGPAGEKGIKYACIVTGKSSFAGRGGSGAVMGSKNLKAIAVKGSKKCSVADQDKVDDLCRKVNKLIADTDKAMPYESRLRDHGTSVVTTPFAKVGNIPVKNWQLGTFDTGVKNFSSLNYTKELNAHPNPCKYCTLQCKNDVKITEGPYAFEGEGPEYETLAMMGLDCYIDDVKAVAYGAHLANLYGIDTISLGVVIAWAMESYEKGVITKDDTEGIELTWGNGLAMCEMVKKIGRRDDGLGWLLGEGVEAAAKKIGKGSEDWAVYCNGLEMPAHSPRSSFVAGLTYMTGASCGGNHEKGNPQHIFVAGVRIPEFGIDHVDEDKERHSWETAPKYVAIFQNYANIVDSVVFCKFMVFRGHTMTHLLNVFNAATGLDWDFDTLQRAGERIFTLQKLLNLRYGRTKEHNLFFPKRVMQPVQDGPMAGVSLEGIQDAVIDYYKYRGWDENGIPSASKIKEVGLEPCLTKEDRKKYL